jgi:fibronectin type 3 domain-containing protein
MKMKQNKKLEMNTYRTLFLLVLIACSFSTINGQDKSDFVIPTPHGNFIFLGEELPVNGKYIIERSSGSDAGFTSIGSSQLQNDKQLMMENLKDNITLYPVFSNMLLVYSDSVIDYPDNHTNIASFRYKAYPAALLTLGVAFLDAATEKGKTYRYRVHFMDPNGNSTHEKTSKMVDPNQGTEFVPLTYSSVNEANNKIVITWYFNQDQSKKRMAALHAYRRIFGKGEFLPLTATPGITKISEDSVFITLTDSTVSPNSMYEYAVIPVDMFGNEGNRSLPVEANTFKSGLNISFRKLDASSLKSGYGIRLSWEFKTVPLARSICIYRSEDYTDNYKKIAELNAQDTVYTDYVNKAMENYYYFLTVNTAIGESYPGIRFSGLYNGSDKPLPPVNFHGEPDKKGVKLFFASEENNVRGFYVYRASGYTDTLQQISGLVLKTDSFSTFIDSSKSLSAKFSYTYAVKAVNDVYGISDFTEKTMVQPGMPTTISTPRNVHVIEKRNGLYVSWEDLSQRENALGGYEIYRKDPLNKEFRLILRQKPGTVVNYYTDTTVVPGNAYTYAVKAFDLFGAKSYFSNSSSTGFQNTKPGSPSLPELRARDNSILISWGSVDNPDIEHYRIYKYEADKKPIILAVTDSKTLHFTDKNVKQGVLYFYFITAIDKHERESDQSRIVTMEF